MSGVAKALLLIADPEELPAIEIEGYRISLPSQGEWTPSRWTIRTIEYTVDGGTRRSGVSVRRPPTHPPPRDLVAEPTIAVNGWDLLDCIDAAAVVHVCNPFSKAGELSVLAVRQLRKPLVITFTETHSSVLGRSLGLHLMADVVICRSARDAAAVADHPHIELVEGAGETPWERVQAVYDEALSVREGRP